jgi:hypothetical protein
MKKAVGRPTAFFISHFNLNIFPRSKKRVEEGFCLFFDFLQTRQFTIKQIVASLVNRAKIGDRKGA